MGVIYFLSHIQFLLQDGCGEVWAPRGGDVEGDQYNRYIKKCRKIICKILGDNKTYFFSELKIERENIDENIRNL